MGRPDLLFDLSPTQSGFVHSDAHIVIFKGPMGEGKTFAGCSALIRHARRCGKNIRGALVRDTHTNIKISTVPDIKEELGDWVSFHDDDKKMIIHCTPRVEMDLFGIDDPASLSKLQGPQYAIIWLEEPAPIIDKANAGLPKDVFNMAVARASRQTGTILRVQITQNPADEDHWTEEVAAAPRVYEEDPDTGVQIIKEVYEIPYGENKFLNPLARVANRAAFKDDAAKFSRYVLGVAASVCKGIPVATNYDGRVHYSRVELPVVSGAPGLRMYDAWHHPVCIIAQLIPPGQMWVHHVCVDGSGGSAMAELLDQQVGPTLARRKYKDKIVNWRDIGDPTMNTPDQSTRTRSTAKVVEGFWGGRTRFEPGPTRWRNRIDPLNSALTQMVVGGRGPKILISSSARPLHRALNGGWHWKKDNNGKIIGSIPVKDIHGDVGDAFCYGVSRVFPYKRPEEKNYRADRAKQRAAEARLAASYGGAAGANLAGSFYRGV